jgi:CheY-like chemotaxis protein
MPKMDGYEIARLLRAEEGFSSCVLVALTGSRGRRGSTTTWSADRRRKGAKLLETRASSAQPRPAA